MLKRINSQHIALLLSSFVLLFLLVNINALIYGLGQLKGQIRILMAAKEVEEILVSKDFPDSLKIKLESVQEIREFAVEELGLSETKNYSSVYDQKGEEILWIVTASKPFKLEAYEWSFPFLGSFPYKGYFDWEKVNAEEQKFSAKGYDTDIRSVSGWSTLGWFRDPILSNMLLKSEGDLANTIIHELTHQTLFIKNEVDLNENLATFVGDFGALQYLEDKYGRDHPKCERYLSDLTQEKQFKNYILQGTKMLDSLYTLMDSLNYPNKVKRQSKNLLIRKWVEDIDENELPGYRKFKERRLSDLPNNTFFMGYLRYNKMQNEFEDEYFSKYEGNLDGYLEVLFERYRK